MKSRLLNDAGVKAVVQLRLMIKIASRLTHLLNAVPHPLQGLRFHFPLAQLDCQNLQRRTQKADLIDVLFVYRRHRASNVSLVPDQTFLFQLAQRLPNRTAADTQQLCHLVFLNSFTGFEFSLENLPPDLVRHFLPQGFIV